LGVQARKIGSIDVVAALILRSEDNLDLKWLIHKPRIGTSWVLSNPKVAGRLHHLP
jgi:hypothetical protein